MDKRFVFGKDVPVETVGEGLTRKILAHSENIMLVEMWLEKGAVGTSHTHPHEQATYIISGQFLFTNGDETCEVGPGDSLYFAPDVLHGTTCLETGHLIDVFTPCRKDFLSTEQSCAAV